MCSKFQENFSQPRNEIHTTVSDSEEVTFRGFSEPESPAHHSNNVSSLKVFEVWLFSNESSASQNLSDVQKGRWPQACVIHET